MSGIFEMPKMTFKEAVEVIAAMRAAPDYDTDATPFTPQQREALIVVGVAWKMGQISLGEFQSILGVGIKA